MKNGVSIALGYVHPESAALDWDAAQVRRLARHLGYRLVWPPETSRIPLVDQVRDACADAVITPSPDHLGIMTLHSLMCVADVETCTPRLSFARWPAEPKPR